MSPCELGAGAAPYHGAHRCDENPAYRRRSASGQSPDANFATIANFTDLKDIIDLSRFDANNGVVAHFSNAYDPGGVNVVHGADNNTYVSVQGAAGTPELFFEMTGIHNLTAANFHV